MIVDELIIIVTLGAPILLAFMLVPTILELRNPADPGPRLIRSFGSFGVAKQRAMISPLVDLEEHHELKFVLIPVIADVINVLTDAEV